jgi:glutaredoxin
VTTESRQDEPRIVVLTRPGCHLCEQAIAVIEEICDETGDSYEERNIDRDPQLQRQYSDQVPVIFVDGRQHDFWRVDPDRLRAALTS